MLIINKKVSWIKFFNQILTKYQNVKFWCFFVPPQNNCNIIGYSEIKKILKDKFNIDLDLNRVFGYELDLVFENIINKLMNVSLLV